MPTLPSTRARWSHAFAALAGLFLLGGCKFNFWRMDGHQTTMITEGPVAKEQLDVFMVTVWVTLVVFILVGAALAYATWKFRAKTEADEHAEPPPQGHGNPLIELGLIGASILALVIIAVPTLKAIWSTYDVPEAEAKDAYEITAVGYQWWFKFEYPSEQQMLDATNKDSKLIVANELVIPAGRPIRVHLRTNDVIHSFWVPKLAGKVDMIPNRANHLWLKADKPGYYWGQCAEYCGDSHAVMRFRVIALGPKEYGEWLDAQLQTARNVTPSTADASRPKPVFASMGNFKRNEYGFTPAWDADAKVAPLDLWRAKQFPEKDEDAALVAQGRQLFVSKTCSACHTIRGHGAAGIVGPDLTHVGSRTTIAGGLKENNKAQLQRWIHEPAVVKPGNKMGVGYAASKLTFTEQEEHALVAYLESLK